MIAEMRLTQARSGAVSVFRKKPGFKLAVNAGCGLGASGSRNVSAKSDGEPAQKRIESNRCGDGPLLSSREPRRAKRQRERERDRERTLNFHSLHHCPTHYPVDAKQKVDKTHLTVKNPKTGLVGEGPVVGKRNPGIASVVGPTLSG